MSKSSSDPAFEGLAVGLGVRVVGTRAGWWDWWSEISVQGLLKQVSWRSQGGLPGRGSDEVDSSPSLYYFWGL